MPSLNILTPKPVLPSSFHMLNHLVCGNFHQEEEDEAYWDSPRKSRKSRNKNPYSTRGLDQFSALLADLDRKRQEIYSQARPQDISFIRFVSSKSSSNDFVPIVIKAKGKDQKHKSEELKVRHVASNSQPILEEPAAVEVPKQSKLGSNEKAEKKNFCCNVWSRPSFYLPVMLIMILGLLTVFGRSVATICTCILWYTATTVKDSSSSRKSIMKKKRYRRGLSEKAAASEDTPPRKFGRQKSW
ncbi:uncharacterized protein LOC114751582 [Neltuma alba]|uniref:uncharacterized protein LOC114751582 n=1 Tax=Neltuma alba TaxID=207710 RepID=UPI0010A393B7|nr:uncharacterized protein LOC114751582 [Prosopis alba]